MKALLLLGVVFVAVLTAIRKAQGRKKLALLEGGKMCVHCGSTNVTPGQAGMICGTCGMTTSWALINQPALSDAEIDKISKRDGRSPFRS
jgi:hypothetical protein